MDIFSKDKVKTTSAVFRPDLKWEDIMRYIFWNFVGEKKVNIVSLGCSDGSEPLSYALYLHTKTPKSYYKKFNISGSDIEPEMVKIAQSGKINLSTDDFTNMKKYIKNPESYFKELGNPFKITNNVTYMEKSYEIDPEICEMMQFKRSNILKEVNNINPDEYYVLNIRNVFPYLKISYIKEILRTLSEKLKPGSLFVYGKYDTLIPNFRPKLLDLGFSEPLAGECLVQKM